MNIENHVAVELERLHGEIEMLRADFNDCNAERARWRAEAERLLEKCDALTKALKIANDLLNRPII
jgi:chromosome segregation ATPase